MKPLYLLLCCLMAVSAVAQDIQYVDKKGRPESKKKAAAMTVFTRVNDTCWEKSYYKKNGPCFLSVRYKDQNTKVQHGRYIKYDRDGCADTIGYYANGKKESHWLVTGDSCRIEYVLQYENDNLVSVKDLSQLRDQQANDDTVSDLILLVEIESEFPGGLSAWHQFLNKNMRYPQEAIDDDVMGQTNVAFMVNTDGATEDPYISKSADYFLDKESIRIIMKSGRWVPAIRNGQKVKSYKIQPLVYRLEYERR